MKSFGFILSCFLCSLMFFSAAQAEEKIRNDNFIDLGLAASIGNAYGQNWQFNYGGSVSVDFNLAKHFSLGSALTMEALTLTPVFRNDATRIGRQRAFNTVISVIPKLLFPFYFSSSQLVPFIKAHWGVGVNSRRGKRAFAWKIGAGAGAGIKYLFADNWGVFLDYGYMIDWGISRLLAIESSLGGNLGLIYSF